MKKTSLLFLCLGLTLSLSLHAVEGMWLPFSLDKTSAAEMKRLGMRMSVEDIYSFNKSSLKDAVVHFGGGCTAELIGSKGLLLTNYHCGYGQIQNHSSLEKDYLKNGFWAMNQKEELTNPGLTAAIVKYMRDVTNLMLEGTDVTMPTSARDSIIAYNIKKAVADEKEKSGYDIEILPFSYGNQYILIAKETFRDVRLVGAPPSSIGKYGADTDNWVWPRHTGDFSLFRIYANGENKPAEYAEDNVPYTPVQFLSIQLGGFKTGDFTLVYGFPGRTQSYLPAVEVEQIVGFVDPLRIAVRDQILKVLDAKMRKDDATRIKYAAKYASISNGWKKWIGEVKGLKETKAVQKKRELEAEFRQKLLDKPELHKLYAGVLDSLELHYTSKLPLELERYNYIERVYYGSELMRHHLSWRSSMEKETIDSAQVEVLLAMRASFLEEYDRELDAVIATRVLPDYVHAVRTLPIPEEIVALQTLDETSLNTYVVELFTKSYLLSSDFERELREDPKMALSKLAEDPTYQFSTAAYGYYRNTIQAKVDPLNAKIERGQAAYVAALMAVFPKRNFYPDANSTLRVSYGQIEPYDPIDGILYKTQTYLDGVMAKYVPGDYEFDLPAKLIELYEQKDYGRYGENGKMPVCFIASNHTTGGNSGSPALNAKGELIGLNFDRAWEGTMSDINYDRSRCRNIMVDIRYVLFIIDKYAGAAYLLEEMQLKS